MLVEHVYLRQHLLLLHAAFRQDILQLMQLTSCLSFKIGHRPVSYCTTAYPQVAWRFA